MHYKNGREARVGDRVLVQSYTGHEYVGLVIHAEPKCETCNLQVIPYPITNAQHATAKECLHIDDVLNPQPKE
jgi:hypothetical protein